jgi:flagellar protein FlaG
LTAAQEEYKVGIRSISGNDTRIMAHGVEGAPAARRPPPKAVPAESSVSADKQEERKAQPAPSTEDVRRMSRLLDKILESLNWNIRVRIDESSDRIVTQIVDPEKNAVIKQIPPQELLEIMSRLKAFVGVLLDREA